MNVGLSLRRECRTREVTEEYEEVYSCHHPQDFFLAQGMSNSTLRFQAPRIMEHHLPRSAAMTKYYRKIPNSPEPHKKTEDAVRCTVYFDDVELYINVAPTAGRPTRNIYTIRIDSMGYSDYTAKANTITVFNSSCVDQHNSDVFKLEFDEPLDAFDMLYCCVVSDSRFLEIKGVAGQKMNGFRRFGEPEPTARIVPSNINHVGAAAMPNGNPVQRTVRNAEQAGLDEEGINDNGQRAHKERQWQSRSKPKRSDDKQLNCPSHGLQKIETTESSVCSCNCVNCPS